MPALPSDLSRRKFIGSCCAAVGSTGLLSALAQLRLAGAVAGADSATTGYKALVCLFLNGGNDANNLIVPSDPTGYAAYAAARHNLALGLDQLLPITPRSNDGRSFGLHPSLGPLRDLFTGGRAAIVANVGTLVVPTTRAQYRNGSVPLPIQLYSHNDQQHQWQTGLPDRRATTGWGGRLADLTHAFNENPSLSMSITLDGQNAFQVGRSVAQLSVHRNGVVQLNGRGRTDGAARVAAMRDLLGHNYDGLFETAFGAATHTAIDASGALAEALRAVPEPAGSFPAGRLGDQLRMIARLIAIAPQFGLNRQVFFARLGGWDLHDSQMDAHAALLAELSQAMKAFYDATAALGRAQEVTTFTASDFGRTLTTNGDGSDHGWGSHHLVVGGAVRGGDIYGTMPVMAVNGPDDAGRGRWIPTTSVDEYSATLARWFGVSAGNLPVVLPNLGRFARPNLGFMA